MSIIRHPLRQERACKLIDGRRSWYVLGVLLVTWAVAVAVGWNGVRMYEATPGRAGPPPSEWPVNSEIRRQSNCATLLLFAHPKCPCTRATIDELAIIMARCQGMVEAKVLFFKPSGTESAWAQTDLWHTADTIPRVTVLADSAAAEARRFSVTTSGHVLLYSQRGELLFSGGITSSRGHAGDNPGRIAIIDSLTTGTSDCSIAAVFGCSLVNDERPLND